MKRIVVFLFIATVLPRPANGQNREDRVADLERKLSETRSVVAALQKTIEGLASEMQALRQQSASLPVAAAVLPSASKPVGDTSDPYRDQILRPHLGQDERESELSARPELFIQSRFQALPIHGSAQQNAPSNFSLTRMETRWSGRISDKIGLGFELQYHPAPAGAAVELVNDAFVEYYANDAVTIRAGQFVKPFGFDIQQSSSIRESPERGIFAGYFFPGG